MLTRIIRILGIVTIVLFSIASIFFSMVHREFPDPNLRKLLSYTSFFEDRFYDIRMRATLKSDAREPKVILTKIDEYSLEHVGRFPFTRTFWAKYIDKMKTFGAKVVAFDVFFVEPEKACSDQVSPDEALAKAIVSFQDDGKRKVILPYSMNPDGQKTDREFSEIPDVLYNAIMDTKQAPGVKLSAMTVSKDAFPHPIFHPTEAMLGHIEASADSDGIMRHYQMTSNVDELYFPGFSISAYQAYTDDKPVLELLAEGAAKIKFKDDKYLAINAKGEVKVRWTGGISVYPDVSLWDVLKAPDDDAFMHETFKDAMVFVGSTAYGAHDLRHTPIDPQLPGVYFHMNMFSMLQKGLFPKPMGDSTFYSWIILLGGTLIMVLVQLLGRPILDLFVVSTLIGGLYSLDTYYLLPLGYEIKLFFCLFSIGATYSFNTFLNFYLSNQDKAFLKNAFGNYISPELIDEMYQSGEPPKLGGNEDIITAYFTDIASFSTFSEKLTATQLVELLNEYLTAMTDILLAEKGTLDKYEGDAIIAFIGAPMKLPDHAQRACRVAAQMQAKLVELRKKWVSEGEKWPKIVHDMRMRIGINSGSIVTGNMGSTQRMNYTMMGDSVNLAARLEEAAKQYGIFSHLSHFTLALLDNPDEFLIRELDTIKVVGKSEPVTTYELMCFRAEADENLLNLQKEFSKGLEHYKKQEWDLAIACFEKSLECEYNRFPEFKGKKKNPSEIYIERCNEFKEVPPPPDWDGVYTLTEK